MVHRVKYLKKKFRLRRAFGATIYHFSPPKSFSAYAPDCISVDCMKNNIKKIAKLTNDFGKMCMGQILLHFSPDLKHISGLHLLLIFVYPYPFKLIPSG